MNADAVVEHVRTFRRRSTLGAVAFRFDDAPITDLAVCGLLRARNIPAELAVPVRVVGSASHLSIAGLRRLARAGHALANHSLTHGAPPSSLAGILAEIQRGTAWFDAHGLPTWSFVQPGTWVGDGAGPGHLSNVERARSLARELGDRFVCIEGYARDPIVPRNGTEDTRIGLAHITLDETPWRTIDDLLGRIVRERAFVEVVFHTARCVKRLRGPGLAWRLLRTVRRCDQLAERGALECVSVLAGAVGGDGAGRSLLDGAVEHRRAGWRIIEPVEPLVPGVCYELRVSSSAHTLGRRQPAYVADLSTGDEAAGVRVRVRRRGPSSRGIFSVLGAGRWCIRLPIAVTEATLHVT